MWIPALLLILFGVAAARNDFLNEVIVTSSDVLNGVIENIGKTGESYLVYGCGQTEKSFVPNDHLYQPIVITDNTNAELSLFELMQPTSSGSNFLSDQKIVTGPISVRDTRVSKSMMARYTGLPFTIYLVSTKVPSLPVTTAFMWAAEVIRDSDQIDGQPVRGVTILSAEAFFTLRHFNITAESAYIVPRGYDAQSSEQKDEIMNLSKESAFSSHVTIFGPIATIFYSETKTGRIQFGFDVTVRQIESLTAGSSFTFLSPNLLSLNESYSTSYTSYREAFQRQVDLERDTQISFEFSASSVRGGDSVALQITNEDGEMEEWKYSSSSKEGPRRDTLFGNSVLLRANVAGLGSPETYPRFIIKVTSGALENAIIASFVLTLLIMF